MKIFNVNAFICIQHVFMKNTEKSQKTQQPKQ